MRTIRIQTDAFDVSAEIAALAGGQTDIGAIVSFSGHVRADEGLTQLKLEHYPGMTEREIARHIDEAERRWPLMGASVIHRIGVLRPGDAIVLVATASRHRQAAFSAAEFLMDYLKTRAPFWKEETRGTCTAWVQGRKSDTVQAKRWE